MSTLDVERAYLGDDGQIRFYCESCGAKLKVPPIGVGRRVKCRKCTTVLTVPDPDAAEAESAGDLSALDELAAAGGEALEPPRVAAQHAAAASLAAKPIQEKSNAATSIATAMQAAGRGAGAAAAPLLTGTLVCVIGAAVGGAVWIAVAETLDMEIGYVAVLVGALAGGGMRIAGRGPSVVGGVIAAAVAALGIVVAKAILVMWMLEEEGIQPPLVDIAFAVVRYSDPFDYLCYVLAIAAAFGGVVKEVGDEA